MKCEHCGNSLSKHPMRWETARGVFTCSGGVIMDFSQALHECKAGKKISRAGWNGKGMWLLYVAPYQWSLTIRESYAQMRLLPWIGMKTVDGAFVPWLASQTDILADDWGVKD